MSPHLDSHLVNGLETTYQSDASHPFRGLRNFIIPLKAAWLANFPLPEGHGGKKRDVLARCKMQDAICLSCCKLQALSDRRAWSRAIVHCWIHFFDFCDRPFADPFLRPLTEKF
jgi:hypothetical protein